MTYSVMSKSTSGSARSAERSETPAAEPGDGEVDSRVRRSRDRVLTCAFDLLSDSGVGGFTVDEVASRSGVAKTTIYRHWPSREALVLDAASRISAEQEVPDTGRLEADVRALLANLGHLLSTARWSSVVPSIVDVAERDPEFARIHGKIQRGHAAALREVLERAVRRGELAATADQSAMISALIGPLYYRRWFVREPIDEPFIQTIVRNVISGAT
ncbi:TetR/AcrR family transcriptional regulator [Mycobacterium sp. URHB0044]|uniref:TetR/AcrR family transcriptional regulator n=1 Tax=Mycobacterium sp. URHB0044 TaxID=1380386 RepID=UPI0018CC759F|nr:TetR/AcrR family transcriptional regulator [Mycobacterium sp. URHB0044]